MDVEYLEDRSQWFKLSKLYEALNNEAVVTADMTASQFWTQAHKVLKPFERIYIRNNSFYSQYPRTAVVHYKIDNLVDILEYLNNHGIINCEQLISEFR